MKLSQEVADAQWYGEYTNMHNNSMTKFLCIQQLQVLFQLAVFFKSLNFLFFVEEREW